MLCVFYLIRNIVVTIVVLTTGQTLNVQKNPQFLKLARGLLQHVTKQLDKGQFA